MKLFIKNMISAQSVTEVHALLGELGLHPLPGKFGVVEIAETRLAITKYGDIQDVLKKHGYELLIDRKQILVEKVKILIMEIIYSSEELPTVNYSQYISATLGVNYTYLSKLFSKSTQITIQQYIINHKIERVKEMLIYNGLTLSEIAWKMHYSSAAHLSAQFRKVTGQSPMVFKKSKTQLVGQD